MGVYKEGKTCSTAPASPARAASITARGKGSLYLACFILQYLPSVLFSWFPASQSCAAGRRCGTFPPPRRSRRPSVPGHNAVSRCFVPAGRKPTGRRFEAFCCFLTWYSSYSQPEYSRGGARLFFSGRSGLDYNDSKTAWRRLPVGRHAFNCWE